MKFRYLILVLQAAASEAVPLPNPSSPGENDVFAQRYLRTFCGLQKESTLVLKISP